ncbi:MAG: conjugal transfer protein TraH [Gammaproteobacteria bacterium]
MKRDLCILACLYGSLASASINSDLTHFFNSLGFNNNVTAPNAYQSQQAGFYSGGSLFARDSVRDTQIAHIDLPSFRSGCGGIDLFTGGFSFVNSQQLVDAMKNIMNNSVGYAFNLALESTTPEIANVMKYINTLSNDINRANINSCETAAGLVGAAWPKTHEAQQQVCQDIGTSSGLFTDWAAAREGCSTGGDMTNTLNHAQNNSAYKSMLLDSGNLAWKALQQNSLFANDTQLAELLMSLSGTIIVQGGKNDKANRQFKVLSSLATDNQLLNALLHGGTANIYFCDTLDSNGCLNPSIQSISIAANSGLQSQVAKLLDSMTDKILADTPLTQEEIGLLQATRLPIYKMLNVESAFAGNKDILDLISYADVIATDILFQYLDENLTVVHTSVASLQYPETIMAQFEQSINQARASVRGAQLSAYSQIAIASQLIEQTQNIEQMLAGQLSSQLTNTLKWADGLR